MKNKNVFNILLLFIVTILILYFILKDNFFEIINNITKINPLFLLIAIFLIFGYWFLKSIILYKIALSFDKNYKFKKAFRIQLLTNFFNAITPFSSGGQPFQIYSLNKNGINYNDSTNIVMQEFIIYQLSLVTLGIVALIYNNIFNLFLDIKILETLVALGFIINLFVIVSLFMLAYYKKLDEVLIKIVINLLSKFHLIKNKELLIQKWNNHIEKFNKGARKLTENKFRFIKLYLISLFSLLTLYLIPCIILYGMGDFNSITPINSIIASAYVILIGSFVPIPGGTGGLEYGFIAFFGNFISGSTLPALMLIWRLVTYYFGIIIGAIALNLKGKK